MRHLEDFLAIQKQQTHPLVCAVCAAALHFPAGCAGAFVQRGCTTGVPQRVAQHVALIKLKLKTRCERRVLAQPGPCRSCKTLKCRGAALSLLKRCRALAGSPKGGGRRAWQLLETPEKEIKA